jgi:transposase
MIQITPHMRILVAVEPIDFRAGIDGLAAACRKRLDADPFSGAIFVFRNRLRTALKLLVYDGQGFWLCQKRLSSGRFAFWPDGSTPTRTLQAHELQLLLMAGDPTQARAAPVWRPLGLAA